MDSTSYLQAGIDSQGTWAARPGGWHALRERDELRFDAAPLLTASNVEAVAPDDKVIKRDKWTQLGQNEDCFGVSSRAAPTSTPSTRSSHRWNATAAVRAGSVGANT